MPQEKVQHQIASYKVDRDRAWSTDEAASQFACRMEKQGCPIHRSVGTTEFALCSLQCGVHMLLNSAAFFSGKSAFSSSHFLVRTRDDSVLSRRKVFAWFVRFLPLVVVSLSCCGLKRNKKSSCSNGLCAHAMFQCWRRSGARCKKAPMEICATVSIQVELLSGLRLRRSWEPRE